MAQANKTVLMGVAACHLCAPKAPGWVPSLGWEDPLEEGMATHSSILAWRIPMDRGACWATVHGITKSPIWLSNRAWAWTGAAVQAEQGPLFSELQMGPWVYPLCFLLEPTSPLWDFAQERKLRHTCLHTLLWAPHSSFSPSPWSKTNAISSFLSVVPGQPLRYSLLSEMLATLPLSLETE